MTAPSVGTASAVLPLLDALPVAAVWLDDSGAVLGVNEAGRQLHAASGELLDAGVRFSMMCRRRGAPELAEAVEAALAGRADGLDLAHAWPGPQGQRWLRTRGRSAGALDGLILVQEDLGVLKSAEARAHELGLRLAAAIDASGVCMWELDVPAMVVRYDEGCAATLGYAAGALRAEGIEQLRARIHPEDRERFFSAFDDHLSGRTERLQAAFRVRAGDGRYRRLAGVGRVVERDAAGRPRRMLLAQREVEATARSEAGAERGLPAKDSLFSELHHRAKNNLQLAASVLHFGSRRVTDPAALEVLADCQRRLRSMALVHQQLYAAGRPGAVGLGSYIRKLIGDLRSSYRGGGQVGVSLDLDDTRLPPKVVLPLGMIVCELVTNSLSHAFPGDRAGTLRVSVSRQGGTLRVAVDDDGIGLPSAVAAGGRRGFGLTLVGELTRQLRGRLTLGGTLGCCAVVEFPLPEGSG